MGMEVVMAGSGFGGGIPNHDMDDSHLPHSHIHVPQKRKRPSAFTTTTSTAPGDGEVYSAKSNAANSSAGGRRAQYPFPSSFLLPPSPLSLPPHLGSSSSASTSMNQRPPSSLSASSSNNTNTHTSPSITNSRPIHISTSRNRTGINSTRACRPIRRRIISNPLAVQYSQFHRLSSINYRPIRTRIRRRRISNNSYNIEIDSGRRRSSSAGWSGG